MTAQTRVLLLPLIAVVGGLVLVAAFYVRASCAIDGRESSGDKHECSILQSLEATHRDKPISGLEFSRHEDYHIVCVPGVGDTRRVWIMLNPQNPPFYKQLPGGSYSLSREQYEQIVASRHATSTVEESLSSHVQ